MAYGETLDTSASGPPAPIPWDTKIIKYAKKLDMPMQKYFLVFLFMVSVGRWVTRRNRISLYRDRNTGTKI